MIMVRPPSSPRMMAHRSRGGRDLHRGAPAHHQRSCAAHIVSGAVTEQPVAPSAPIPITVVTGFLGAGKTTLVNRLVSALAGRERVGVVVNEAGEIGLDGELLGDVTDDVVEIADGCVCCTSQGELLDAITRLHRAAGRLD